MKFGKLQNIEQVNFSLPQDSPKNTKLLTSNMLERQKPEIYVGAPTWGNKNWINKIYPLRTPPNQFLRHYVLHFNTVEVSSFHYSLPAIETIQKWFHTAGPDFRFCPKFHQVISHKHQLNKCQDWVVKFYDALKLFENKLGMPFLQLSPYFSPQKMDLLELFLQKIPSDIPIALELRHPDWFREGYKAKMLHLLEQQNVTAVITDTAGRRDVLHLRLTTPHAFIRFVANDLHPSDYTRLDAWVKQVQKWIKEGLQSLYFFIHSPEETHCPELIDYFIENLNKECHLDVKRPRFIPQSTQGTLF